MADQKLTQLDAATTLADDDLVYVVDDVAGTPGSKKLTGANLKASFSGAYATSAQGALADSAVQPGDDAATLGSGAAADGHVPTADGAGGLAFQAPASGTNVGDATPQDLGTAATGVATDASREDHVHAMPTAAQVGADEDGSAAAAQAFAIQRDNHTGTQAQSTVTDLESDLAAKLEAGDVAPLPTGGATGDLFIVRQTASGFEYVTVTEDEA